MTVWLQSDLMTLAFCWRLARRDGIMIGLTSHDRDLVMGGLHYRATPGMMPSAIERSAALDPDRVDLTGVLTSDAISADDLAAGRWDGAQLRLYAVDWQAPDAAPLLLVTGSLGAVQMAGERFEVELSGPASALEARLVDVTSPSCRAALGDKACRVDLAGRTISVSVSAQVESRLTVQSALVPGVYAYGQLRWASGANAGLSSFILSNDATSVTLGEAPRLPVLPGDRAMITEGCDRRFATCTGRFANALNFRGEPHLPGNDVLTRYVS